MPPQPTIVHNLNKLYPILRKKASNTKMEDMYTSLNVTEFIKNSKEEPILTPS
jgi:hypothetical protein